VRKAQGNCAEKGRYRIQGLEKEPQVIFMAAKAVKKESKAAKTELISKDMTLGDVITKYPNAGKVFMNYGMHCIGCHISPYESVECGASTHGITGAKFKKMMEDLNAAASKK